MLCIFCKDNYSFSITEKKLPKKNNCVKILTADKNA